MYKAKIVNTSEVRDAYSRYKRSTAENLWNIYRSWSGKKQEAYDNCKKDMEDLSGHDFRLISHNQNFFSCGFMYEKDGKQIFRFHTATQVRDYIVE